MDAGHEQRVADEREPGSSHKVASESSVHDHRGLAVLRPAGTHPADLPPAALLQAQRLVGNRAISRALGVQRAPGGDGDSPAGDGAGAGAGAGPSPRPSVEHASEERESEEEQPLAGAGAGPSPRPSVEQPLKEKEEESESEEEQPPAGVGFSDPLHIDAAVADADLKKLLAQLPSIPTLNVEGFIGPMTRYVECAKARDKAGAHDAMSEALAFIGSRRLFEVNHKRYARMVQDGAEPAQVDLDKAAEESVTQANLWSKMTSYFSLSRAEDSGGLSLEASVGGKLFNGLDFGMHYRSNPILAGQWKRVSRNYVERVRGEVHAAVFRGIHPTSVLTKTEWPIILKHLKEPAPRRVTGFFVHVFDFVHPYGAGEPVDAPGAKTDRGEIEEKTKEPIVITSEEDWNNKLTHFQPNDKLFTDDQAMAQKSESWDGEARLAHKGELKTKDGKDVPKDERKTKDGKKLPASFAPVLEEIRQGKQLSSHGDEEKRDGGDGGEATPASGHRKGWVKERVDEINKLSARFVEKKP